MTDEIRHTIKVYLEAALAGSRHNLDSGFYNIFVEWTQTYLTREGWL